MRTLKTSFLLFALLGIGLLFLQCTKDANPSSRCQRCGANSGQGKGFQNGGGAGFGQVNGVTYINSLPKQELSAEEKYALLHMREEELLAQDVYKVLFERHNVATFSNIAQSEARHTNAVKTLLDKYGIDDVAAAHQQGIFKNEQLQSLFNSLIEKGKASVAGAFEVGATVEDLDIKDLMEHSKQMDNQDILFVFNQLHKGSRNHIRTFYSLLKDQGRVYVPQFITPEYFNLIITSPYERGRG